MSKSSNATRVERAVAAFRAGEPVLVHDAADREGEVDLVYPAESVTPDDVARLRNDAGGLICVALGEAASDAFDLPFLGDVIDHPAADHGHLGYDDRSSFSLPVNHRDTYTGITDEDRALTITELGKAAADPASVDFATEFRAPGHVHVLRSAPSLSHRKGHTELAVALAEEAGVAPAAVVCEMLDDETGEALSVADAKAYADREGLVYVEGSDLLAAFSA
ncbi:3,4-dihydroxy-2-butanone-4-phosphate synthase [Halobacterium sp. KA-4]|uniref:3,4-dihydroxy-2-butanone-4-phosphate synthase n=1 Tax=Halobacterium sp. KA-4 TaxID=2896367 RepID=UPI001E45C597|nr:3,4-dihydroxy-2-butanone-4-phosphate synthase [Halobacterium sp. KA-4]MCD2198878.1 3,4-dihydroxy-2-butanone-4-phosphate synthase [Halobacterium sp. KA-4]